MPHSFRCPVCHSLLPAIAHCPACPSGRPGDGRWPGQGQVRRLLSNPWLDHLYVVALAATAEMASLANSAALATPSLPFPQQSMRCTRAMLQHVPSSSPWSQACSSAQKSVHLQSALQQPSPSFDSLFTSTHPPLASSAAMPSQPPSLQITRRAPPGFGRPPAACSTPAAQWGCQGRAWWPRGGLPPCAHSARSSATVALVGAMIFRICLQVQHLLPTTSPRPYTSRLCIQGQQLTLM
jgi:hypothetical protein